MKNTKTKSIVALAIVLVLTVVFGIVGVTMLVAAVIAFTFPRLRKKEA